MSRFADRSTPEEGRVGMTADPNADAVKQVAASAKARILCHPHLKAQRIWCEFDGGNLFLRGHVPSFFFKQLAQEAVIDLDRVRQVVNEIEVVW